MRAVVVGKGDWGKLLVQYIHQNSSFEVVEIFGRDFFVSKIPRDVQVVFVATPLKSHFDITYRCLKEGLNVFVEKPTCNNREEFEILKGAARDNGVRFYTDYIYLTSPSILKIKEVLSQLNGITRVQASIKQFGKFYEGESVLDVLGGTFFKHLYFFI